MRQFSIISKYQMKRSLQLIVAMVTAIVSLHTVASGDTVTNLLINPGFESGELAPWSIGPMTDEFAMTTEKPRSGNWSLKYVLSPNNVTLGSVVTQRFEPLSVVTEFSFWIKAEQIPQSDLRSIMVFDNSGVDERIDHFFPLSSTEWTRVDLTSVVQGIINNSAGWKIRLINVNTQFINQVGDTYYFDDFTVATVPEPSALAMFGLVGAGIAIRRWRRKR
jgi:hypothetical protein